MKLIKDVYAMGRSTEVDPLQKFRFRLIVPTIAYMGFTTVSGLQHNAPVTQYSEGMWDYAHKLPGKPEVAEITCTRGAYRTDEFHSLMKQTLTNRSMRQTYIVLHLDRYGAVAREWQLAEAWVSNWQGSDMDAGSNDVAMESLTVQFEYYLGEP